MYVYGRLCIIISVDLKEHEVALNLSSNKHITIIIIVVVLVIIKLLLKQEE